MQRLRALIHHLNYPRSVSTTQIRRMSDLPYTTESCCSTLPVQSPYQPKGEKIALGGYTEVYSVGEHSDTAIIGMYSSLSSHLTLQMSSGQMPPVCVMVDTCIRKTADQIWLVLNIRISDSSLPVKGISSIDSRSDMPQASTRIILQTHR